MRKYVLFLFLCTYTLHIFAQNVPLGEFYINNSNREAMCFASLKPGDYAYKIDLNGADGAGQIVVFIESADPTVNFRAINKVVDIQGIPQNVKIEFSVSQEAVYKFSILFINIYALNTQPYLEVVSGDAEVLAVSAPRQVRLEYSRKKDKNKTKHYEWLYGEAAIPVDYYTNHTSVGLLAYLRGYIGLSKHAEDEMQFGFIPLTDASKHNDEKPALLLGKGDKVFRFGNQTVLSHLYKGDAPLRSLMNIIYLPNDEAIYSAWIMFPDSKEWEYLATWKTSTNPVMSSNVFSRIEMYNNKNGYLRSKVLFSNIWGKEKGKKWVEFNQATVVAEEEGLRTDFAGGKLNGYNNQYFLSTGGYFQNLASEREVAVSEKTNWTPDFNTDSLSAFISEILQEEYIEPWDFKEDIQIPVLSAEASEFQPGGEVEKSFDSDFSTIYHSTWTNTTFPVTLTYHLNSTDSIDYLIYHPRSDGGVNGNIKEFELWVMLSEDDSYTKIDSYDFKGASQPSILRFPTRLAHPKSIRLVVKSGVGDGSDKGVVSCSEMLFYKKSTNPIPNVFANSLCSALRAGVTLTDIEQIPIKEYRELGKAIYHKTYPTEERVRAYKPYPQPLEVAEKNKTSPYSLLDNPTGIFIEKYAEIVVFVGETGGQKVSLRSVNHDKDYDCTDYPLVDGLNVIRAKDKGLLYVMYHTDDEAAQPVQIHIASGAVNGYFDVEKDSNAEWSTLLDAAACDYIDVLGQYAHLTFAVEDFKKYTPNIEQLISVYDSIVFLESEFIGLNKYHRENKNRMYFYVSPHDYYMFATSFRTGYSRSSMHDILNPDLLRTTAIWGPAHEVGHMNQTTGFNWVGLTEVSNNIYSMHIQRAFGNPSRLYEEKLNSEFDGIWNNRYEKGFTEMIAGKQPHMKHKDVFCKLIPFWQLELYCSLVEGRKDFYADVHEQIRVNPVPSSDAEAQLQFMKICCMVAETDFTEFFEKWGLLAVIDENVADHSSIQNVVNYSKSFVITQKDVNEVKEFARQYTKPAANMHYIHDGSIELFKSSEKIVAGKSEKVDNHVNLLGWKNVVAYEVYDGEKLIFITPFSSFDLPDAIGGLKIYAVPAKGESVAVKL